jgi:regulator of RNase E activity RraA
MVERDVPVQCAGVRVNPGDLVFGDVDGVVVVPREAEARVLELALRKVAGRTHRVMRCAAARSWPTCSGGWGSSDFARLAPGSLTRR